ncbi:MAG: thioredoxin domain-containing protein [Acidobacteria bacterium]|nr:thioredoxin domain-containing protein [Acidobacteriota bacterium]
MKRSILVPLLALLIPVSVTLTGCDATEVGATAPATESGAASPDDVIAVVGGSEITLGEIEGLAAGGLIRVRQSRYDLLRGTIERLGIQRMLELEAAERGISVQELQLMEVDQKVQPPTERELERTYEMNKHRSGGKSFPELRDSMLRTIIRERVVKEEDRFINQLKEKWGFSVTLAAPRVPIEVTDANPTRGDASAPITFVEFGDFQCPFCRRAHPTVERVLDEYGDKIRYVFMDYPLENHERATPAAEAAYCAGEQDKYWEYVEHLMVMAGDLNDNDLRQRAEQLGLDTSEFMSCFTSGRHTDRIAENMKIGTDSGVDRTPTFFINGRILTGAKSYETFKLIIDEELATLGG